MHRPTPEEKAKGALPDVLLCDFGLSLIRDPEHEWKAFMPGRTGTEGYIPPEIRHGATNLYVGPEIDMWAFGVMLYEMCVAYKPT